MYSFPKNKNILISIGFLITVIFIYVFLKFYLFSNKIVVCEDSTKRNYILPSVLSGIGYKYKTVEFNNYIDYLKTDKCDIVVDIDPLPEREEFLIFSKKINNEFYVATSKKNQELIDKINKNIDLMTNSSD
jgi:ABC-type amino acid transport substrate-binding protein